MKATLAGAPGLTAQLDVDQRLAEHLRDQQRQGARRCALDYAPTTSVDLAYDAFVGNEAAGQLPRRTRVWQGGDRRSSRRRDAGLRGTFDYGTQDAPRRRGSARRGAAGRAIARLCSVTPTRRARRRASRGYSRSGAGASSRHGPAVRASRATAVAQRRRRRPQPRSAVAHGGCARFSCARLRLSRTRHDRHASRRAMIPFVVTSLGH